MGRGNRMIQVGAVDQLGRLLLDGLGDIVVTVTETVNRKSGYEIEVAVAVHVEQIHPVSSLQHELWPAVGLENVLLLLRYDVCGPHSEPPSTERSGSQCLHP